MEQLYGKRLRQGILFAILSVAYFDLTAQLSSDFTISTSACIDETVSLTNSSLNAANYEWDFCLGDMLSEPTLSTIDGFSSRAFGYRLVEDDGLWYGFFAHRENEVLYRIDFGDSPLNTPSNFVNLGNPDNVLNTPVGFDMIKHDGNWYAVFGYDNNGESFGMIDFGSDITNAMPSGTNLGNFGELGRFQDVSLILDNGDIHLISPYYNGNSLYRVNFGNSLYNSPSAGDIKEDAITGANLPRGVDVVSVGGEWKVFVVSQSNNALIQINLGTDPAGTTFDIEKSDTHAGIASPYRVELVQEGANYFAAVSNASGSSRIIDLKTTDISETREELTYTATIPSVTGIDLVRFEDRTVLQGLVFGFAQLRTASFSASCGVTSSFSSAFEPSGISFSSAGDREVELRAYNDGVVSVSSDTVTILPQVAPSISYTSDFVCVSSALTFTPTNSGLTSYSWDFDEDGIEDSSDESPQVRFDTLAGAGSYTVRVDVNDGTCNNFFEQQITIYPEPPVPTFTAISSECANTDITFTNTTDESMHAGIMLYKWDFDNDGIIDSTDPNPTYAYSTAGVKTVVLIDSIPGCSATSLPLNITINPGPSADFFAPTTCQGEAMMFTNTSEDAISYFWDFTDGFTSTNPNPSHIFSDAGNYFVELTATDGSGCSDTRIIEVAVSDSPQISFDVDIPCTSNDGTQFFDLSTVDNADIVSWTWFVDDEEVSTDQNPQIIFGSTGIKNIRLDVQSSNGCESSYSEDIEVLSAPVPDFNISIGCQGEESMFTDNTSTSGNSIVSWLWTIDGINYSSQDISHVFTEAGNFDITLEVTGQNFCSESITKTIEIIQLPTVNFSVDGECDNQLIVAVDNSSLSNDPVVSRRWMLDGSNVGSGTELYLENLPDASYELELELETISGCIISSSEILEINEAPESSFSSSRTYGIPGDLLTFTNTSSGEISNEWFLDEDLISTNPDSRSILFEEFGTYMVSLVTQNSLGCYDTATQEILIAIPEVDLAIGSFELVQENGTGRIFLEVQNFSNLPVEITEAKIVLENELSVSEQILEFVGINESKLVSLNVGIPLSLSRPSYFCVSLASQYVDYPDLDPVNNEKCITIQPDVRVEDPFPNPVTDQFRLKLIVPEDDEVTIKLINSAGKLLTSGSYEATKGLNNFFVEMSAFDPGIYHIVIELLGTTHRRKVIKL